MDKDELLRLIGDLDSRDDLIRNFAANIFLNIKDDESISYVYDNIKKAGTYAKSMFLKLVAAGKKKGRRKYLLEMMGDADPAIRAEAAAITKKSAHAFSVPDYSEMLGSGRREVRLTALQMLSENPEDSMKPAIISNFLGAPPANEELYLFDAALKFVCLHAKNDVVARAKFLTLTGECFRTGRLEVLKTSLKYAVFLIDEAPLLQLYSNYLFQRGEAVDGAIIESALCLRTDAAIDFLAGYVRSGSADAILRRKCMARVIESGREKHAAECLRLMARSDDQALKFFCWNAIQNVEKSKAASILTGLAASSANPGETFEFLTLLSLISAGDGSAAGTAMKIFAESRDARVRSAALDLLERNNYQGAISENFLTGLIRSLFAPGNVHIKHSAIPLLVRYLPQGHLEALFAECCRDAADYSLFCEAYIKRARGLKAAAGGDALKFYARVLKSIFEYGGADLVAAAAALAPPKAFAEFIHEYAAALTFNRGGLYGRILRRFIVSALKASPDSIKHFLEGAAEENLALYTGLVKETSSLSALRAIACHFYGADAGRPRGVEDSHGPIYYAIKDAAYFITRDNLGRAFETAGWPEFSDEGFAALMSGAFLAGLKDALAVEGPGASSGNAGADLSPLYAKTPTLMKFYKMIVKKLSVEDKFGFYNMLQKAGGDAALEIISELG